MPGTVPLARVYDALDAEAYRAFRAAMRRSRGGTVRLADLVGGLAEVVPQALTAVFQIEPEAVATLARPPSSVPDLAPMANDSAVREAMTSAYQRAGDRPVTAADLATAVMAQRPLPSILRPPRPVVWPKPPRRLDWTGEEAISVMRDWLAAQSLPPAERDAEVAKLNIINHKEKGCTYSQGLL